AAAVNHNTGISRIFLSVINIHVKFANDFFCLKISVYDKPGYSGVADVLFIDGFIFVFLDSKTSVSPS
ncbi:MAG: hypothetical protein ABGX37_04215, partial [Methylococcales bacterium]